MPVIFSAKRKTLNLERRTQLFLLSHVYPWISTLRSPTYIAIVQTKGKGFPADTQTTDKQGILFLIPHLPSSTRIETQTSMKKWKWLFSQNACNSNACFIRKSKTWNCSDATLSSNNHFLFLFWCTTWKKRTVVSVTPVLAEIICVSRKKVSGNLTLVHPNHDLRFLSSEDRLRLKSCHLFFKTCVTC